MKELNPAEVTATNWKPVSAETVESQRDSFDRDQSRLLFLPDVLDPVYSWRYSMNLIYISYFLFQNSLHPDYQYSLYHPIISLN